VLVSVLVFLFSPSLPPPPCHACNNQDSTAGRPRQLSSVDGEIKDHHITTTARGTAPDPVFTRHGSLHTDVRLRVTWVVARSTVVLIGLYRILVYASVSMVVLYSVCYCLVLDTLNGERHFEIKMTTGTRTIEVRDGAGRGGAREGGCSGAGHSVVCLLGRSLAFSVWFFLRVHECVRVP